MAQHRFYDTYAQFARKFVSANPSDTQYTIGPDGKEIFDGTPEVRWQEIVHIKNTRQQWTHGYFIGGSSGGGGGEAEVFPETTTAVTIGGLAAGTDITGQSAVAVLDAILSPEFAPYWHAPTVSWTKQSQYVNKVYEVGSLLFSEDEIIAYLITSIARAEAGSYMAEGGSFSLIEAVGTQYGKRLQLGSYDIGYRVTFDAGTDIVKSSKGHATNRTASNATTLLSEASPNSKITRDNTIASIVVSSTYKVYATYRILATIDTIDALSSLPLSNSTSAILSMPNETLSHKHRFAIPSSYTLTNIQIYNPLSGEYLDYDKSLFETSSMTRLLPDGTMKPYTVYTRNHGLNGANTFKITFNRA